MPWHVARSSSCPSSKPFAVIKDADGSVAGCHATQAAARKQLAALYANEPSLSGPIVAPMEHKLRFLADLPELAASDGEHPSSWIQVAKTGKFSDSRYGEFTITTDDYDAWLRNFESISGSRLPVDPDHAPEKQGVTEAVGWATSLEARGDELWAEVEWNSLGAELIRDRRYLFISPSYTPDYKSETGESLGTALVGVGLTNRPFLEGMAAVSLSKIDLADADKYPALHADDTKTPDPDDADPAPSDSRGQMDLAKIIEALKLDEGSDEDAVLAALTGLIGKVDAFTRVAEDLGVAKDAKPDKVLHAVATLREGKLSKGQIIMTAAQVADLKKQADEGARASNELKSLRLESREMREELGEKRFERHFSKALREGRVDAQPETKQLYERLFEADSDTTVETLDSLQPIVSTTARGSGGGGIEVPDGVDPDRYELDRRVRAYMDEHDEDDYVKALDKVASKGVPA